MSSNSIYTLTNYNIDGVLSPIQVEYTTSQVAQTYFNNLLPFVTVLNLNQSSEVASAGNLASVVTALENLLSLAFSGISIPNITGGGGTTQSYMNASMAENLNAFLASFQGVSGFTSFSNLTLQQLQSWQSLGAQDTSIGQNINIALGDALSPSAATALGLNAVGVIGQDPTQTFQSLVELDYVETGNAVLTAALGSLQSALSVTQNVMNTLDDLQGLHNDINVVGPISSFVTYAAAFPTGSFSAVSGRVYSYAFSYNSPEGATTFAAEYNQLASAYFGQPITPILGSGFAIGEIGGTTFQQGMVELVGVYTGLVQEIAALSAQTGGADGTDTLLYQLKQVQSDLKPVVTNAQSPNGIITSAFLNSALIGYSDASGTAGNNFGKSVLVLMQLHFQNWVLDGYSTMSDANGTTAGAIQTNITSAITASENLNDTQKEDVNNYLFIFQEYYKSASDILTAITQIIEQMAKNMTTQ